MSLIHTADLHAQAHTWVGRPQIRGDLRLALRQIEGACIQNESDLLLAGDIFDGPRPDNEAVRLVQECLHNVLEAGQKVLYIVGNHDPFSWCDTSPDLRGRVQRLQGSDYYIGGRHRLMGFDYMPKARLHEVLAEIPPDVVALSLHQRFREAFNFDSVHCCMDDIPPHVKLVLAGDIHKTTRHYTADDRLLLYPGSPYMTSLADNEDSGAWLVQDNLEVDRIPFERRPILRLTIDSLADIEEAIVTIRGSREVAAELLPAEVADQVSSPLVALRFYPDTAPNADTVLQQAIGEDGHVFPYPLDRESERVMTQVNAQTEEELDQLTLSMFLEQEVNKTEQPIVFAACDAFLNGQDIYTVTRKVGEDLGIPAHVLERHVPSTRG